MITRDANEWKRLNCRLRYDIRYTVFNNIIFILLFSPFLPVKLIKMSIMRVIMYEYAQTCVETFKQAQPAWIALGK